MEPQRGGRRTIRAWACLWAVAMPAARSGLSRPELARREWSSQFRPGVGLFVVKGDTIKLGPGFRMSWRVIEKPLR